MTNSRDADAHSAAVQYLTWALEEIEKTGDQTAARHARMALKELQASKQSFDRKRVPATVVALRHGADGADATASERRRG